MKTVVLLFLGICLTGACHKGERPLSTDSAKLPAQSSSNPKKQAPKAPEYQANPYDSIGILHNRYLDSVMNYVERSGDTSYKGRSKYLRNLLKEQRQADISFRDLRPFELPIYQNYKTILFMPALSVNATQYLQQMVKVLEAGSVLMDFPGYYSQLTKIEDLIIGSLLPERERTYLLITASMLRHSGYFWKEVFTTQQMVQTKGILGLLRKVAGVIVAIAADTTTAAYLYFKTHSRM